MDRLFYEKGSPEEKEKKLSIKNDVHSLSFNEQLSFYKMAIKYWWAGDAWLFAQEYALSLIKGFKK